MKGIEDMRRIDTRLAVAAGVIAAGLASTAAAGTGGTEFDGLYTLVEGWMQGTMGALAGIVGVGVGLWAGVTRGSMMGALSGVGTGTAMYYSPDIIGGIVTATLPTDAALLVVTPEASAAFAALAGA